MGLLKSLGDAFFGATVEKFQVRIIDHDVAGASVKIIQTKGFIPLLYASHLKTIVSVRDVTDYSKKEIKEGKGDPVLCLYEKCQTDQMLYQQEQIIGSISEGDGWPDWVQVAVIPLQFLVTPKKGRRKLRVILFISDTDDKGTHWASALNSEFDDNLYFTHEHKGKGYTEIDEDVEESNDLTIKIAVAIAMSEGKLDDAEGVVIKNWIKKTIDVYDDEERNNLKKKFNESFKDSYSKAKEGKLELGKLIRRFEEIADENAKYKCLDLGYAVMAADGIAAPEELEMLDQIASSLKLNNEELNKIRDTNLANLNTKKMDTDSLEALLNIDTNQSKSEIRSHLRKEFKKWNSRINTLESEQEKKKAQEMINLIGTARKKYK